NSVSTPTARSCRIPGPRIARRLETVARLCLSKRCRVQERMRRACSCRKGKTLRTALRKKADIQPSPAGISGNADVSRALETVLASLDDSKAEDIVSIDIQGKSSLGD